MRFFVPNPDEEAAKFVGAADGRNDGGVFRRSDCGALPSDRALRVSSGGLRLRSRTSHRGEIRVLLDAASKKRSAPGSNGVHYRILDKSAGGMCSRLSSLCTTCFEEASFPKQWRRANIVLLEKPSRDPSTPSAYRLFNGLTLSTVGFRIGLETTLRYLGVTFDSGITFEQHLALLGPKIRAASASLGRLMPNLRGPGARVRRLYATVVHSVALYGAPVWAESVAASRPLRERTIYQRASLNKVSTAYRDVAAGVLAFYRTLLRSISS